MAVTLEREVVQAVTTTYDAARYTAPANFDASINEIRLVNKSGTDTTVDVELYPLGNSTNSVVLLPTFTVPGNTSHVAKGYRALLSGDELQIKSGALNAIDAHISVLEMDVATSIIYQGYVQDVANGSYETLFTATTEVAVNDITFINKSGSAATIDLQLWPLGVSGNATQLISSVSVAATDDFEYVGVINLKSTDVLKVKADTNWAIDVILSAVE